MNALVLTDLHAHLWPRFATTTPEGRNSRLQDLLNVLAQALAYAREHSVQDLLLGGDLFHRRHFITWGLYVDVMESLMSLIDEVDHTVMIVGNHDWEDDRAHALLPFRFVGHEVDVVDQPAGVTLSDATSLFCIPYNHSEDAVVAAFQGAPAGIPVFSHFAASGVPLESDYYLDSVVKLDTLRRFPYVLFGHVHKPSAQCAHCGHTLEGDPLTPMRPCDRCKQEAGRAVYVGAPLHFDFGDVGPRYMLHLRGHTAVRVPLQAPQFATARWPRIPPAAAAGFLRDPQRPPGPGGLRSGPGAGGGLAGCARHPGPAAGGRGGAGQCERAPD